jgi:hypothetical protein
MPAGRPPKPIHYCDVSYNGEPVTIGRVHFKDSFVHFLIDTDDKERVMSKSWHVVTGAYIGCYYMDGETKKTLYLHNFIMNRDQFNGRGQTNTIDHINGIGFDNRRVNLREVNQSLQNINTKSRSRTTCRLPDGFSASEIPRNIWYIPACGGHGERFAVEFKGIPDVGDILWKTTSSKSVSIQTKLDLAKIRRDEIIEEYPVLLEHSRSSDSSERLKSEFNQIVTLFTVIS